MKVFPTAANQRIIDNYFKDPEVQEFMKRDLGEVGRVSVDWAKDEVRAQGPKGARVWKITEMINLLRFQAELKEQAAAATKH